MIVDARELFAFLCGAALAGLAMRAWAEKWAEKRLQRKTAGVLSSLRHETEAHALQALQKARQVLHNEKESGDWLTQSIHAKEQKQLREKMAIVEEKERHIAQKQLSLATKERELKDKEQKLLALADVDPKNAKKKLLADFESELEVKKKAMIKNQQLSARAQAQSILIRALERLKDPVAGDASCDSIDVADEELRGRLIGREGRNRRFFEQCSGVQLLFEKNARTVVVSCFAPERRKIAVMALQSLLKDGRIHFAAIEKALEKAKDDFEEYKLSMGLSAANTVGIQDFAKPPGRHLARILGAAAVRTSSGQDLLAHSVEVASIMGLLAAELGLNVALAKRIGLLHDIGKVLGPSEEGHAQAGANIAERYGEDPHVVNGIACHHGQVAPMTLEAALCSFADAISAKRPGARSLNRADYLQRLTRLENVAKSQPGVKTAFALQSGRELLVIADASVQDPKDLSQKLLKTVKEAEPDAMIKLSIRAEKMIEEYLEIGLPR